MLSFSDFFPSDTSRASLIKSQGIVAEKAMDRDDFGYLRLVAGVDHAFIESRIISGIVVLEYASLEEVERQYSIMPVSYPYVPTFLSFREGPAIVNVYNKLKNKPDLLMVDGAGLNHPRRAGIATHVGVALDVPTIGITKKVLCGSGDEPSSQGEETPLLYEGKQVGWLLKSSSSARPIIVAPGHRVSLESSLSIVKACLRRYKLPEPVRLAHEYVNRVRKEISIS